MRIPFIFSVFALALVFFGTLQSCESLAINNGVVSTMEAPEANNTYIKLTDYNWYMENDTFYAMSLVDNLGDKACAPLLAVEYLDASGKLLDLKGTVFRTADTVKALNQGVPGRGRTSFMHRFPKSRINGEATTVRARPIGADLVAGRQAIIYENQGFYKQLKAAKTPQDTAMTPDREVAWTGTGQIYNPWPNSTQPPQLEMYIYGRNTKLYLVDHLMPAIDKDKVLMQEIGSMNPLEKRPVSLQVTVAKMPAMLRDSGIGRIDVQAFH